MATLHTSRLILRPLVETDAEAYAAMRYHPDVARWLLAAPGEERDAALAAIRYFAGLWASDGHAPWGLFIKQADGREGRLVGQGGLRILAEFDATEVLYALHPDAWGKGYATELGEAALRFGFETRRLPSIFAITKPDNLASQAVMQRLGLQYRKNVVYKDIKAVWFDIDADTWRTRRRP